MKEIKITLSSNTANKILKGDKFLLKTNDKSSKMKKEFLVEVIKIMSDIPRCQGCGIRLDTRQSYKFKTGHYCWDCYSRRKSE
jgi:hypothetical protein